MQVFAVFNICDPTVVQSRLNEHYSRNFLEVGDGTFFVATDGETTQQVGGKLGFGEENLSTGIVVRVTSYWGRSRPDHWEWITVKMEANGN